MKWVPIASIEPDGTEECVCIAVSHPSKLYITDHGIVTHNTTVDAARDPGQSSGDEPADSVFKSFQWQPVQDGALSDAEREVLSSIRREQRNAAIGAARVALPANAGVEASAPTAFVSALKKAFGKDVLFIHPGNGTQPISFDAASPPNQRNIIVIDSTTKKPLLSLAGHELVHALKAQRPELWNKMRDDLLAIASEWGDYAERLRKMNYQDHELVDEFIGDLVGGQFREPSFWKKMEAKNPTLFQTMARAALDFLNRIIGRLGGLSRDVRKYFKDLDAAQIVVINALEKYAADGKFPERVLTDAPDTELQKSKSDDGLKEMRLVSVRMSDAAADLQEKPKEHKATADGRTIEGEPIEAAGYLVRKDADMETLADQWLDSFAEGQARAGKSMAETRDALAGILRDGTNPDGGAPISGDITGFFLVRLMQERGAEFGFDPSELQVIYQKKAGEAGAALRLGQKILDPLQDVIDNATATTGAAINRTFGAVEDTPGDPAAGLNGQLQLQMQQANENEALKDALIAARERGSDLRKALASAKELLAEETARANQEREVGIAIGQEEGFAAGQATVPPAPPRELDLFETWLMGERDAEGLDGLPTLEQVARKFITPQRWDADRFRQAVAQLFPNLDENILDDAVERIGEVMANKMEATRRRTISAFMDQLEERGKKRGGPGWQDTKFATFFKHISRAAQLGVLNSQVFGQAFAHAWGLNGLTAANIAAMRNLHQQITAVNTQGQPLHYGMERETMERRFIHALNALLPGQRLSDFLFNNYQARVLSSLSSMINQFSALGRILTPLDAVARAKRMGRVMNPAVVMGEWFRGVRGVFENLPFMLTAVRGESLGHLPSVLQSGHVPVEQRTQALQAGERVRIGGRTMGRGFSTLARYAELWTWRGIRAAEGLTGLVDADTHFVETLAAHHRNGGKTARDAYNEALNDIYAPSAADWQAALARARQEQAAGDIGAGETVVKRRAQEHINHAIEQRGALGTVARTEQLTGYMQFKTLPLGPVGFAISKMMAAATNSQHAVGRKARFLFLFGRFLGHTIDQTLAYVPGLHLLTLGSLTKNQAQSLAKLRIEVFGSEEAYQEMVNSRATSGAAFLLSTGLMMALAFALQDDEDDEPWFNVTGSGGNDIGTKELLKATGKWGENQVRFGDFKLNYSQIPELAPLLSVLGNISDAYRFEKILNVRTASKEGEKKGDKVQEDPGSIGATIAFDVLTSPVKRSTYRQWFDLADSIFNGRGDKMKKVTGILTKPIEGMTRVPIVVDVDKALDRDRGLKVAQSGGDIVLQRLPFVTGGKSAFNAYGERVPGWDVLGMFPSAPPYSDETKAAAQLNVETGTKRSVPGAPDLHYADGSVKEVPTDDIEAYQQLAGKLYTESLLRHEADIRRAYEQGGSGSASKIVGNISEKANKEAKARLGLAE